MAHRIVYKGQDSKICSLSEATKLVAEEGWSWTKSAQPTKAKKSAKAKQVFKVEAEADVIPVDSPSNDGNPINIDFGTIKEE